MDKRTLILAVSLFVSYYLINIYFDNQRSQEREKWVQQQVAKKEKQISELHEEIAAQTITPHDLPLVEIYADAQGKQFLSYGVLAEDSVLSLAWNSNLPDETFIRMNGSNETPEKYNLAFTPHLPHQAVVYQKGKLHAFPIGTVPLFGKFTAEMLAFPTTRDEKPPITFVNFIDGNLFFPQEQLDKLKAETHKGYEPTSYVKPQHALVLLKQNDSYLPLAVYQGDGNFLVYLEQMEGLESLTKKPSFKTMGNGKEQFYVLENDYQQLVFSNRGAALVEINLPFHTSSDKHSVVKEIAFDRDMKEHHPYNSLFPERPYYTPGKASEGPYEEHAQGTLGGYYPLLRRDLIQTEQRETINVLPRFYALNIVSDYPETAETYYQVKSFDKNKIVFESNLRHRKITKTFTLPDNDTGAPYTLELSIQVEGDARGLWLTSGVPEVEWISNGLAPSLKYRMTRNDKSSVESIELPADSLTVTTVHPDWISNSNGFLGMILDPLTKIDPGYRAQYISGATLPSRLTEIDQQYDRFPAKNLPGYMVMLPLNAGGGTMKFRLFAGPFATNVLKEVDAYYANPATDYTPDYIASQTSHGWFTFISAPFSKFLWILMDFFHWMTGSWGLSIILLTVALRLMLYPLNAWSAKSMIKMKQIQPQMTALQERYKNDPRKLQLEIINLYRENGVNPLSGCFPLLIQMPFLIGMFDLLKSTFELRGACFIPGWIDDLAAPDVLFSWNTPIWFIGNQFHLLPILSGLVMFFQQKLTSPAPADVSKMTEQQRQQQSMGTFMSLFLMIIFYNFPSGLNIYFLSSNLLGMLQQWYTSRTMNTINPEIIVDKKIAGKGASKKKI